MSILRDVLAQLDIQVRGGDAVRTANADLNRYVASAQQFGTLVGPLRLSLRAVEELRRTQAAGGNVALGYGRAVQQSGRSVQGAASEFQRSVASFHEFMSRQPAGGGGQPSLLSAQTLSSVRGGMIELAPAIAGAAAALYGIERAAQSAWAQIREVISEGDEIGDSADRLGISARAYQQWSYIAQQTGTSIESVSRAFPTLARNMLAGGHGATSASAAFHQLGVSTRDAHGAARSQEDVFGDTVVALSRVTNQTQQAALAQRVFGRAGAQLLPLIRQTPGEVDRLRRRFQELGGGLSDDVVEGANDADQALNDLDLATRSMRSELVGNFLPGVIAVAQQIGSFVGGLVNAWRQSSAGIVVLGGLTAAWRAVSQILRFLLTPLALGIGLFVGLFLLVEDFVTYMRGGKSVVGQFLDPLLTRIREARAQLGALVAYAQGVATSLGIQLVSPSAAAPAAPIVETAAAAASKAAASTSTSHTEVHAPITISGISDPVAAAAAAADQLTRRMREFADTLPLARDPQVA